MTTERLELQHFYEDCNRLLEEQSFSEWLTSEYYRVYLETKPARSKHCKCCMFLCEGSKCLKSKKERALGNYCWKAMNAYTLKKEGWWFEKTKKIKWI